MRKVTTDEASRYCKQNNLIYFETSAKNNTNIESAFLELVKKIVKRQDEMSKILGDIDSGRAGNRTVVNNHLNRRTKEGTKGVQLNNTGGQTKENSKCCK